MLGLLAGTNNRPVPLEHNIYYAGELYQVMYGDSHFNAEGVRRAMTAHRKKNNPELAAPAGAAGGGRGGRAAADSRPTGRGQAQGPNRGGGGRGYGGRGGGADSYRKQLQGEYRTWRRQLLSWLRSFGLVLGLS